MNDPETLSTLRARRWIRTALVVWGVFAAILCIKVLVEGNRHSVYGAFVSGPRDWWAGNAMYDDRGYYYSPTFSVLFTPFGLLPDRLGQMLWGLASVGLFVWSLRVFYRAVLARQHWPVETEAAYLLLALAGSLRGIWSLQSNALVMACILFAAAAIVNGRWWRAAWLLATPVYIKVWPLIAAGLLGIQRPRKLIAPLMAACVALGLLPFLTKPPAEVVNYYRAWLEHLGQRQATAERFTGYRDAWTIWEQIGPVDPQAYFTLQAAGGLATLGWCVWLCRRQRPAAEIVTYTLAAWACWQLLLGPGTERLTYLIAAPFASWAVVTSFLDRRGLWLAGAAYATLFFLGAGFVERTVVRWTPTAVALQPLGVIVFAAWLIHHAAVPRPGKATQKPSTVAPFQTAEPMRHSAA